MNLSIGQLAIETRVKVVTIRYYEQIGILPAPARTPGNYRIYGQDHARTLHFIRRCRELGFSLDQVRELLRLASSSSPSCAEVCDMTAYHLSLVEAKITDLTRLAKELRRMRSACNGNLSMKECRILKSLSHD